MPVIDQHVTWRKVEERLDHETDPILRRNLEMLLLHMKAEAALDMETLMGTVSERAIYQMWHGRRRWRGHSLGMKLRGGVRQRREVQWCHEPVPQIGVGACRHS